MSEGLKVVGIVALAVLFVFGIGVFAVHEGILDEGKTNRPRRVCVHTHTEAVVHGEYIAIFHFPITQLDTVCDAWIDPRAWEAK